MYTVVKREVRKLEEREIFSDEMFRNDYTNLISQALSAIYDKHDYNRGYDLATQAKLLAKNYIKNDILIIESDRIRGRAYLGIDSIIGHDLLEKLYYENRKKLQNHQDQLIKLEMTFGTSKRIIGEFDEAIRIFSEVSKHVQLKIEECNKDGLDITEEIRMIIRCYLEIGCCLIFRSQQRNYPGRVKRIEEKLKQFAVDQIDSEQKIHKCLENPNFINEGNNDLIEAERYLKEALLMSRKHAQKDLESYALLDYACVLVEKENFEDALGILDDLKDEPFAKEILYGFIMNEIGIIYVNQEKLEEAKEIFDRAWNWLCKRNDINELSRNCYGTALYFFKKGNLDLTYAFAELAYKKDQNISSLKLLYEVSLLKYISAQRLGNESEYVFYRSEYDRYKLQLERRG